MIAVLTGLLAGLIHVWTGPDHLTAIAPLAVRRPERAWIPGARWGLGHSAGVAVVGLLAPWAPDLDGAGSSHGHRAAGGAPAGARVDSRSALGSRPLGRRRRRRAALAVAARLDSGGMAVVVGRTAGGRHALRHRPLGAASGLQK